MKTTLIQAAILVGASVIVALVYNAFSANPLPLVRQEQKTVQVSDGDLFSDSPAVQEQTPKNTGEQGAVAVEQNNKVERIAPEKLASENVVSKEQDKPEVKHSEKAVPPPQEHNNEIAEHISATVTYEQVKKLATDPNVLFIDARNAEEYGQGHIGNAINIYTPEFEQNIHKVITLPRDKRVVVYCGGGACELSHELAAHMGNLGFQRVYVYTGGWHEWSTKREKK